MGRQVHLLIITKRKCYVALLVLIVAVAALLWHRNPAVFTSNPVQRAEMPRGKIAIVIDDFGTDQQGVTEMLDLPLPLTCAVMPFQENAEEEARRAFQKGHEVIIHMPMEPHHGKSSWLGEKAITSSLTAEEIQAIIRQAISQVPHAVGLNNHMGSKITEDEMRMKAILQVLKEQGFYILDSKTTMETIVAKVAAEVGVVSYTRNIFLDNERNVGAIKKQLRELAKVALEQGSAIGIGHVGPQGGKITAQAIGEMQQEIEEMGLQFVKLSELPGDHN